MRWIILWLSGWAWAVSASGPVMVMHQVAAGEHWALLAERYQLSERRLRLEYNRERFLTPLRPGQWIWVPDRPPLAMAAAESPSPAVAPSRQESLSTALPALGPPDPAAAPKTEQLLLTLASAARAAATDELDQFLLSQSEHLADDTLSFGTRQLTALPWLNPDDWRWDYQLPLFDREPRLNSQMALPLWPGAQGELGLDLRDDRLTYQAGLHRSEPLGDGLTLHLEPLFDYQDEWAHRRGGLLVWLSHPDFRLGAVDYRPLSTWQQGEMGTERPARGRVWFGEGRLAAIPGLSLSGQQYRWRGQRLDLFGSGDKHKAAASRQWSLSYSPWRILKLQTSLLSNSKDRFESRFRLAVEIPLRLAPVGWWQPLDARRDYQEHRPLQHHGVMVLERR